MLIVFLIDPAFSTDKLNNWISFGQFKQTVTMTSS